ncbi:M20 aminoacylase family protein [Maliponia aquimaris]|uniref:Putative hydrolase YxeP n=1 Tax=Maliponia aquimaris TaxID=1673631 RepID=A0A238L0L5_9RHOB|nr:M20 aminoacylase family protein [Maliponia aquimaris]SMX48635.1 putative hydrolase YxeP [Maliponia aquimaris]
MPVKNRIAEWQDELTAFRQDLHRHPELRFEEHRTAALVADRLRAMGCDAVREGVGRTGVVAVIRGRGTSRRVVGFRADMDALPILEQTGADHASTIAGRMHACGHDGHTTMLLGALRYLAETRNFDGTVVALFQPAEEGGGGAKAMLAEGVFEEFGVEEVYALHNWPGVPLGAFRTRPGPFLAAADKFEITVTGKGGHGAMPHLAVDCNLAAAQIVVTLQSIASRVIDAQQPVVVTVGGIRSGSFTYNVLPDTVSIIGTVRTYREEDRQTIRHRLSQIAAATATAHGAQATCAYSVGVEALVNAPDHAAFAADVAEGVSGSVVRDAAPVMGSEDFGDMLAARPGAFLFLGNGEDSADLHNPGYDFNDALIPVGASFFAEMAERRMPAG